MNMAELQKTGQDFHGRSIQAIRLAAGEDFPIFYRMSSEEYVPGGLEIEESKLIARLIEDAGADCIHCSQGVFATGHIIIPPAPVPVGAFVHHAAALKTGRRYPGHRSRPDQSPAACGKHPCIRKC